MINSLYGVFFFEWTNLCGPNPDSRTSEVESQEGNETSTLLFEFPSIEQRIRYYMGTWYDKPIDSNRLCENLHIVTVKDGLVFDKDVLYSLTILNQRHAMKRDWASIYLRDAANVLTHIESTVNQGQEEEKYAILRFGDSSSMNDDKPVIAKTRKAPQGPQSYRSILWPIRLGWHFDGPLDILSKSTDTPWHEKRPAVVWRGACTGVNGRGTSKDGIRPAFAKKYMDYNKNDVDIAVVTPCWGAKDRLAVSGIKQQERMSVEQILEYKFLLSLEGNDVATGPKWQLASSSVVFMPKPSAVSYAMEDLLVPYIHYVPVKGDGSDLVEQLEWARNNDEKCKWISQQATEYMRRLWLSKQARAENIVIRHELANMYHERFGTALHKCCEQANRRTKTRQTYRA